MKKITLSAAILALTMMGCSDVGLDNSVASTSEVTDVQNLYSADFVPALKKQSATFICDNFGAYCADHPEVGGKKYRFMIGSTVSGNYGSGSIWIGSITNSNLSVKADMLHIYTVCVRDCDNLGFCSEHSGVMEYHHSKTFLPANGNYIQMHDLQCNVKGNGQVGTVSNYAAVLNAGKSDEIVMMGSTYSGLDNEYQALRVYQNYLAAPLQNQ